MKVFVRKSDLAAGDKPVAIAFYPDNSDIADDAHGEGVTVLTLPMHALVQPNPASGGLYHLADDWRERAGSLPVEAEAKRRIEETFGAQEQLNALREIVENIVKHGSISNWPEEARTRKAEFDEKWNYVDEVRERARAHAPSAPIDPGSDKLWPRRFPKK